jgi:hypothetical protein
MSNQPMAGMGGMLPGAAAADSLRQDDDDQDRSTSDGAAVGEADREADVERSGADTGNDDAVGDSPAQLMSDDLAGVGDRGSGDNVPVGADDAEADRERTTDS